MNRFRAVIWLAGGLAMSATAWAGGVEPGPASAAVPAGWSGRVLRFEVVKPGGWEIGPGSGRLDLRHLSLLTPASKVTLPSAQLLRQRQPVKAAAENGRPKTMAPADAHKASIEAGTPKAEPVRYPVAPVKPKTEP